MRALKVQYRTWSQDESNFFLGSGAQSPDDTVQG